MIHCIFDLKSDVDLELLSAWAYENACLMFAFFNQTVPSSWEDLSDHEKASLSDGMRHLFHALRVSGMSVDHIVERAVPGGRLLGRLTDPNTVELWLRFDDKEGALK